MGGEEKELSLMKGQVSRRTLSSEEFAGDLSMPDRTQANHEEMNFHFSCPHTALSILLLDEIDLMKLMSYSSLVKYMSS